MRSPLLAALAAATLIVAACGSDDDSTDTASDATTASTAADAESGVADTSAATDDGAAVVAVASTDLGDILVDANGFALYGFTDDADGTPTCEGGCADAWPPIVVESDQLPDGLDAAVFSTVERPDGRFQLKAGDWPLYRFASDIVAGDVFGQGSGGVWFVVAPDGTLIGA